MENRTKVYVLYEYPRWNEEKFVHGVFSGMTTLAAAQAIIVTNHESMGCPPPEFGVDTHYLDDMPFDRQLYPKSS